MIYPRPSKFFRILLPAIWLVSLLPAWPALRLVQAQGGENVQFTAQVGFDGYCKENAWLPVHVEVQNMGADLDATVRVSYKNSDNGITSTSTEVALPATSRKEFFLYIYPQSFLRDFNVSLLGGKRVLKKVNLAVSCLPTPNMLFGVLSDNPATFDVLADVRPLDGFVRVAQLQISELPDHPQAWASLDALIVSNIDTGTLTPEQKQALQIWLGRGGRLFVTGGLKWQGTVAGLKDFMPLDIDSTRNVSSLSELQAYLKETSPLETGAAVSVGKLRGDAHVLVQQDNVSLLIQRQIGFGTVYFLAADPSLRPLSNWDGIQDLYEHLLSVRPPLPRWNERSPYEYTANQALGAIAELGLPSIFYITCLLGLYVLIIGPINYLFIRRMKRREVAWVTIPALVVIFTCVSYGVGLVYRGRTPILNRLVLAQAWDGMEFAQAHAWVGVYSPVRARYGLEAREGFMPEPFGSTTSELQSNNDWTATQTGTSVVMPDVLVEIGGMKSVEMEGYISALPIQHNLVLNLGRTAPIVSGVIENQSDHTLKDVMLVTPGLWKRLGDIGPGESETVNVSVGLGANGPDFYSQDPMSILNINYSTTLNDVDTARQFAFFQTAFTTNYQLNDGNWGIYLIGWVEEPVLPVGLQGKDSKTIDTMLYIHRLTPAVHFEEGAITLPASLFAWESTSITATPYNATNLPPGGYILRFRPAVPLENRSVQSVNLTLLSNTLPGGLIISAWDYNQKSFVQIGRTAGIIEIPDVERFVGPDGEVRLKFLGNQGGWFEIQDSYITMVVGQ